jgi:hypothetical protein
MGKVIGLLSIGGFITLLSVRMAKAYIFLLFPIIFIAVSNVAHPGHAEPRHQLPIYPFLAVCAGYLASTLCERMNPRLVIPLLSIALLLPTYAIVQRGLYITKTDTRTLAKQWIEANIPTGTRIVLDEKGPQLLMSEEQLDTEIDRANKSDPDGQFTAHYGRYLQYQRLAARNATSYYISEIRFPWWRTMEPDSGEYIISEQDRDTGNPLRPMNAKSLEEYRREGYEYFIVNSLRYGHYFKIGSERSKNFPTFYHFYHDLFREATLVNEFHPPKERRPGPIIKIFYLPPNRNPGSPELSS